MYHLQPIHTDLQSSTVEPQLSNDTQVKQFRIQVKKGFGNRTNVGFLNTRDKPMKMECG